MRIKFLLKHLTLASLLAAALTSPACVEPSRVVVSEDNPPTFTLCCEGSGELYGVSVREYPAGQSPTDLWSVGSRGNYIPLSQSRPTKIKYGEAVFGWVQVTPEGDAKPPPLVDGKTYQVFFHISLFGMGDRAAVFTIRDGKVEQQN